jgi:UDP-N-acetylmuramate dehydrogenase
MTSFRLGGNAQYFLAPPAEHFVDCATAALQFASEKKLPFFVLGGGSNIVVSGAGVGGITLATAEWVGCDVRGINREKREKREKVVRVHSGTPSNDVAKYALLQGLSGLEFLAGLPGSVGGAVLMNARCFEREIADCLCAVEYLDEAGNVQRMEAEPGKRLDGFSYKQSPFQGRRTVILAAEFAVSPGNKSEIEQQMHANITFRQEKGHFRAPSAGSVFKNNRAFGKPSGALIDAAGLKGEQYGGAQVAPWHVNFIINTGNATPEDVRTLVNIVKEKVKEKTGFDLETEIQFVGNW